MAFRTLGEQCLESRPDPARIRAAVALLPSDPATDLIKQCLSVRSVSLADAIAVLQEAQRRATAIETIVSTDEQEWLGHRRRHARTLGEIENPPDEDAPAILEEIPLERD